MFLSFVFLGCYCICLTDGACSLKVLAALIMLQAAEVTLTLPASVENLTASTHTAAWRQKKCDLSHNLISIYFIVIGFSILY